MTISIPLKLFLAVCIVLSLTLFVVEFSIDKTFSLTMLGDNHANIHHALLWIGIFALVISGGVIALCFYFMLKPFRQLVTDQHYASSNPHLPASATLSDLAKRLTFTLHDLAEERDLSNAILEGITNGIVATDKDGHIILCNRAAQRILGCQCDHGNLQRKSNLCSTFPCVQKFIQETTEVTAAGQEMVLDSNTRILIKAGRFEGTRRGMVFVIQDITEARKQEKMRRDFIANASHELRTPLSTLHSSIETLLAGALNNPEHARNFVSVLLQKSTLLSRIVENLLDLSRIDAGEYRMDIQSISVLAAGHRALRRIGPKAIKKSLVIDMSIPEGTNVLADEQAFDHALFNLLSNAVKYTPESGRINLRAKQEEDVVKIEVIDNGPGIAPEFRQRIFERFFRVDPGRSRDAGGTGLGLAIVQDLVKQMNGKVWVECPERSGSIFCMTFGVPGT